MKKLICAMLILVFLLAVGCTRKQPEPTPTEENWEQDFSADKDPILNDTTPTEPTATQPSASTPTTEPTAAPTSPAVTPTESTAKPDDSAQEQPASTLAQEYEAFQAMTATQKKAYQESFSDTDAFFAWYNAAYKAYQEANPPIEIGPDGNIPLN